MKITGADGVEVEVYTAAEVTQRETAAVQAKEKEFGAVKSDLEGKLTDAQKALNERAGEFKQFRKLSEDAVAKLSIAERTIYENGVLLQEERDKTVKSEKERKDLLVDAAIRAKTGNDQKLFDEVKKMWSVIGIEANTPEEMEKKALASLGALQGTSPDLAGKLGSFNGGSWTPPAVKTDGEKTFADTERGAAGAKELGLTLETPKK